MAGLAKGLKWLTRNPRLNLAVALGVLAILLALGPFILRSQGYFSDDPLKALAVGEMKKFGFKHRGTPAPGIVFESPQGEVRIADLRGRPLLVNLWATWCVPCVKELPSLERLQNDLANKGLEVVAISMDQEREDAATFLSKNKIGLALYSDRRLLMSAALQEPGIPVSVLYDAEGREIGRLVGAADWASPEASAFVGAAIAPSEGK